jgi:hypothetical protein
MANLPKVKVLLQYPMNRWLGWHLSQSGYFGEEKNLFLPSGINYNSSAVKLMT